MKKVIVIIMMIELLLLMGRNCAESVDVVALEVLGSRLGEDDYVAAQRH